MAFRMFGGGPRRGALNRRLLQAMSRANQMLANGQAVEAAEMLTDLAQRLEQGGFPRRAANMHALAARAWMEAKRDTEALAQARAALSQFLQLNMPRRAAAFYQNAIQQAQNRGMQKAADTLKQEFEAKIKALGVTAGTAPASHGRLPAKCPECAAPVRSDEVEWIDNGTAECAYCGSVIQTV